MPKYEVSVRTRLTVYLNNTEIVDADNCVDAKEYVSSKLFEIGELSTMIESSDLTEWDEEWTDIECEELKK